MFGKISVGWKEGTEPVRADTKGWALLMWSAALWMGLSLTVAAQSVDFVIYNGKIATVDENMTFAQAMAMAGDTIVALGSDEDVLRLAGPEARKLDLRGRTVIPGLVDPHRHLDSVRAEDFAEIQGIRVPPSLNREKVKRETYEAVAERAKQVKPGEWVIVTPVGVVARDLILLKEINREELDRLAPNNPVMVNQTGTGANVFITFNSQAREIIGKAFPTFLKFPEDYTKADGVSLSKMVMFDIILQGREKDFAQSLKKLIISQAPARGITTIGDKVTRTALQSLFMLDRNGEMPVRFGWFIGYGSYYYPEGFYQRFPDMVGVGSRYVWNIGVGEELTESPTTGLCSTLPLRNMELKELLETANIDVCYLHNPIVRAAVKDQIQFGRGVEYHGAGDKTIDLLLDIVEEIQRETGMSDQQIQEKRLTVEHLALVRPDQLPKLKKYGFVMAAGPGYFVRNLNKTQAPNIPQNYGEQFLEWHQPVKSFLDNDMHAIMSEIGNPFISMRRYVTRKACFTPRLPEQGEVGVEKCAVMAPEQAVDRETALRMATSWAAYYMVKEDEVGSLEIGKLADFVVLDRDYFTVSEEEIGEVKPLVTALGGKVVYASPDFGPISRGFFKSSEFFGKANLIP